MILTIGNKKYEYVEKMKEIIEAQSTSIIDLTEADSSDNADITGYNTA